MGRQNKARILAQLGLSICLICGAISIYGGVQLLQQIQEAESRISAQGDNAFALMLQGPTDFPKDIAYFATATGAFICLCSLLAAVLIPVKKYKASMIIALVMSIPCLVMIVLAATIAMIIAGVAGIFAAIMIRDLLQVERTRLAMGEA